METRFSLPAVVVVGFACVAWGDDNAAAQQTRGACRLLGKPINAFSGKERFGGALSLPDGAYLKIVDAKAATTLMKIGGKAKRTALARVDLAGPVRTVGGQPAVLGNDDEGLGVALFAADGKLVEKKLLYAVPTFASYRVPTYESEGLLGLGWWEKTATDEVFMVGRYRIADGAAGQPVKAMSLPNTGGLNQRESIASADGHVAVFWSYTQKGRKNFATLITDDGAQPAKSTGTVNVWDAIGCGNKYALVSDGKIHFASTDLKLDEFPVRFADNDEVVVSQPVCAAGSVYVSWWDALAGAPEHKSGNATKTLKVARITHGAPAEILEVAKGAPDQGDVPVLLAVDGRVELTWAETQWGKKGVEATKVTSVGLECAR